jgi:hypothetical protein
MHCVVRQTAKKRESSLEVNIEQFLTLLSLLDKQEEVMISCTLKGNLEGSGGVTPHILKLSLTPGPL